MVGLLSSLLVRLTLSIFPTYCFLVVLRCTYVYLHTPQATVFLPFWKRNLHIQTLDYISFLTFIPYLHLGVGLTIDIVFLYEMESLYVMSL